MPKSNPLFASVRPVSLLLAVASVFGAVATLSHAVNAQCNSFPNGCLDDGVPVPCSNTEKCYEAPEGWGLKCNNGNAIEYFQFSDPPSSWSNCQGASNNPAVACNDSYQPCGTTSYFSGPCNQGGNTPCDTNYGSVTSCKGPDPGPLCGPSGS